MNFTKINLETWDRKENYNWFTTKNHWNIQSIKLKFYYRSHEISDI